MHKLKLYSAHREPQGHVTARCADQMVKDGDAVPVYDGRGQQRRMVAVMRVLGRVAQHSPTCVTSDEVERAIAGQRSAQIKLREWPVTGWPALRHAQ